MDRRLRVLAVTVSLAVTAVITSPATGQDAEGDSPFGIGLQSAWPSYGVSGLYDMTDQITLQAILGALGTVTSFGGRGLYRFQTEEKYDLYGFGTVGLWRYDYSLGLDNDTESSVGFGGGVGIELDWREIFSPDDDSFPPLYSSFDVGYVVANFDHYNWGGIAFGGGFHYRF